MGQGTPFPLRGQEGNRIRCCCNAGAMTSVFEETFLESLHIHNTLSEATVWG